MKIKIRLTIKPAGIQADEVDECSKKWNVCPLYTQIQRNYYCETLVCSKNQRSKNTISTKFHYHFNLSVCVCVCNLEN